MEVTADVTYKRYYYLIVYGRYGDFAVHMHYITNKQSCEIVLYVPIISKV